MPSYKVANKQIVISPRRFSSKVLLLPLLAIGAILSFGVKEFSEMSTSTNLIQEAAPKLMSAAPAARSADSALYAADVAKIIPTSSGLAGWEWFLIGIWSGIILFFILVHLFETKFKREVK
jgi:hypothetical protein